MSADLDQDALRGYCVSRREALSSRAAFFAHERERAWPGQGPADDLIMAHAMARIETELRWHDMVLDRIRKLAAGEDRGRCPSSRSRRPATRSCRPRAH